MKWSTTIVTVAAMCIPAFAEGTNTLLMYYRSYRPLTLIEPAKAAGITNGLTFKRVVDELGPGWRPPGEGIGLAFWTFKDGRRLEVRLPHHTMVDGRAVQTPTVATYFHWQTNMPTQTITSTDPPPKPKSISY